MGSLSVIPFIGILGILFIVFNIFLFVLVVLTIIFGVIRFKKKKFKKIFLVLLAITVLAGIKDYQIVNEFVNYDEIKHQNLIKEEGKELVAIRDNDYNKVEQYLKSGWDPNENTKSVFHIVGDGVAVKNSGHGSIDTSADTGLPYRNLYFLVFVVVIDNNDNLLVFIETSKGNQIIVFFQHLYRSVF